MVRVDILVTNIKPRRRGILKSLSAFIRLISQRDAFGTLHPRSIKKRVTSVGYARPQLP